MGRKLADATKACRMRRTRGETVRLRVAAGRRLAALAGFLVAAVLLDVLVDVFALLSSPEALGAGDGTDSV
jgi:hypothetical protein